jgi:hypothetical protein
LKRNARTATWRRSLGLSALLTLSTTARAELVEIGWDPNGLFERQLLVAPGKFVELCGRLPAKPQVWRQCGAEAATDFNIHFHEGEVARYQTKKDAVTGADGTLEVSREDDYCWMWANVSRSPVVVKVQVARQAAPLERTL